MNMYYKHVVKTLKLDKRVKKKIRPTANRQHQHQFFVYPSKSHSM